MTHNANKRRTHNDAARAAKQQIGGKPGKSVSGIRRTPYGRRLAGLRRRAEGQESAKIAGDAGAAGDLGHAKGAPASGGEEE